VLGGRLDRARVLPDPGWVRVRRVKHSEAELRALQSRIGADQAALGRDGFQLDGTYTDTDRGVTVAQFITQRTDGQRYLTDRYGPLIRFELVARTPFREVCRTPSDVTGRQSSRRLEVVLVGGLETRIERVLVRERGGRVEVGVIAREPNGGHLLAAKTYTATATLSRRLGNRRVVSMPTGRPVRRARILGPPAG